MKNTRKLLCALLAAALLILSVMPAYAVSVDWRGAKMYLGSSNKSHTIGFSVEINDLKANSKITSIKSSDKSIIRLSSLDTWDSSWKNLENSDDTSEDHSASIYLLGMKKGKATVSFKVDGKTYKKEIQVLGFINPIKTFKLTGISSSNLKGKFAKTSYVATNLKSDAKAGSLKVAAASGWKITSVSWSAWSESKYRSFDLGSGASSVSMPIPKMTKKGEYNIWIEMINTKTKATASFTYHIGG